jgi:hypothetical protein
MARLCALQRGPTKKKVRARRTFSLERTSRGYAAEKARVVVARLAIAIMM